MKKVFIAMMACLMFVNCAMAAASTEGQSQEQDVSRVKVESFKEALVNSQGEAIGKITFDVVGVVFYNPNTFEISEMRMVTVKNIATDVTGAFVSDMRSHTSFGKYEGTIDVAIDVSVDKVSGKKFAPLAVTLTANGDE